MTIFTVKCEYNLLHNLPCLDFPIKVKSHSTMCFFLVFLFSSFTDTCPFFLGHWYAYFWFLVTSLLGFKARVGSVLFICGGQCNVHSLKSTSGATLANLLVASSAASHFPTCISRGGTWLGFERAIKRTEDTCASDLAISTMLSLDFTLDVLSERKVT